MKNKVIAFLVLGIFIILSGIYFFKQISKQVDADLQTNVAVNVSKVQKMTMRSYITAYGIVQTDPGNGKSVPAAVKITAPISGIVADINCYEGERVDKGQVLFYLDSRLADATIEKAAQAVEFAEKNFQRQEKLQKIEGTSDKLYLEAKQALDQARSNLTSAEVQRNLLNVTAPFQGTIVKMRVNSGQTVELAEELAELRDLDRIVITANIPSGEISKVKLNQPVEISSAINNGSVLSGTVDFIDPEIDPVRDVVKIRTSVPAGSQLKNGQFVQIRIVTDVITDCLAVPRESIYTDHNGQSTLSIVEGDIAKKRVVKTGLRDGNFIQVQGDGLIEGIAVVTLGSYALPEETKVHVLAEQEAGK